VLVVVAGIARCSLGVFTFGLPRLVLGLGTDGFTIW